MKAFILAATAFISFSTFAHPEIEVLTCVVTEPFVTYQYSPLLNTLSMTNADTAPEVKVLSRNAKLVSIDKNKDGEIGSKYKIIDTKTQKVFIELTLDMQGSNGMSDHIYPFSAKIAQWYAGCSSQSAPAVDPFTSVYKLKGGN